MIPDSCRKDESASKESNDDELIYALEENPSWPACLWLGLQNCAMSANVIAFVPLIIGPKMCMHDDDIGIIAKVKWTSSLFFITGIITVLQCNLGTRLPIFQGTTYTLLAPIFAVLAMNHNRCPDPIGTNNSTGITLYNDTNGDIVDGEELWQRRMREIQGSLAVASCFEVLIGISGSTTFLMRYIGPLTIAPAVALIGLDLASIVSEQASANWGISAITVALITIFSQYTTKWRIPVPKFDGKKIGLRKCKATFFEMFSVLLAVGTSWLLCYVLTITDTLPSESRARTDDIASRPISLSPWFYFPYPGQNGLPTVSIGGLVAMIAAVFAGIAESIGDYHAMANMVKAPIPPPHVIARGITIEGIGCVAAGVLSASGSTSFSTNLAAIGITRVASRRVMTMAGVIMIFFGLFSKIGALFVMIPAPVIGGIFLGTFGMIIAVGLSTLQYVDMSKSRNQYIVGFAILLGLVLPQWMKANPDAINTGISYIDDAITVLLSTAICVGGVSAAILDNTIPGSMKDRGMIQWKKTASGSGEQNSTLNHSCYDLPFKRRFKFMKFIPIFAEYDKTASMERKNAK